VTETLPKHVLLLKLLKMTASDNDGEALSAMRKANALLTAAGWDWDRLMSGKIVVIEDPFASIGVPESAQATMNSTPWASVSPNKPPPPRPAPPPPPQTKRTTWPLGTLKNKFVQNCYCCGVEVLTDKGFIFKASDYSNNTSTKWSVACTPCNMTAIVDTWAAPIQRVKRKANVIDLA